MSTNSSVRRRHVNFYTSLTTGLTIFNNTFIQKCVLTILQLWKKNLVDRVKMHNLTAEHFVYILANLS